MTDKQKYENIMEFCDIHNISCIYYYDTRKDTGVTLYPIEGAGNDYLHCVVNKDGEGGLIYNCSVFVRTDVKLPWISQHKLNKQLVNKLLDYNYYKEV